MSKASSVVASFTQQSRQRVPASQTEYKKNAGTYSVHDPPQNYYLANIRSLPWIPAHKDASLTEQHRESLPYYQRQRQGIGGQHSTVPDADAVAMAMNDQRWPDAACHVQGNVWHFVNRKQFLVWITQQCLSCYSTTKYQWHCFISKIAKRICLI